VGIYFYGSIIASVILYVNLVSTIKKIKDNKGTGVNTAIGGICIAFITFSIIGLCAR